MSMLKFAVMKTLFLLLLLMPIFTGFCYSQNKSEYSYKDLINQQKIERDELKQTQKEIFQEILIRQKDELEKSDGFEREKTMIRHKDERQNIATLQTNERQKQMDIQADERKQFNKN